jgi:hypothetical protein
MTGFDGELYLRLAGERLLLAREFGDSTLTERARALFAAGVVELDVAGRVVADYARAFTARGRGRPRRHTPTAAAGSRRLARPTARVVGLDARVEVGGGSLELSHPELGVDSVEFGATWRPERRPGAARHHAPPTLTARDDQGTSVVLDFSGGGTEDEWRGRLHSGQPLAVDTSWVEVEGWRIDLAARPPATTARVEALDPDPVRRYLQHCLEGMPQEGRFGAGSPELAVETLIDCGALDPDDPDVEQVRVIAAALADRTVALGPVVARISSPRWRSLLARRDDHRGPWGWVRFVAQIADLEGTSGHVVSLESEPHQFRVGVYLRDCPMPARPFWSGRIGVAPLTFSGVDDHDNFYLGHLGQWSGSDESLEGRVTFTPALDRRAKRIDLLVTAETTRAVLPIPLTWEQAEPEAGTADG